eukprot:10638784-Prorocentrum_lima.AAC.1
MLGTIVIKKAILVKLRQDALMKALLGGSSWFVAQPLARVMRMRTGLSWSRLLASVMRIGGKVL